MAEKHDEQVAVRRDFGVSKQNHSVVLSDIDLSRLLADGIVDMQIYEQGAKNEESRFSCEVCPKPLNGLADVNKHIAQDSHTRKIEEAYVGHFLHRSVKITQAQYDGCSKLVEDIYSKHSAVVSGQIAVRQSIAKELEEIVKRVLPDVGVGLFGSSATKFVLNSSNVNLDLNVGDPTADHKRVPTVLKTCLAELHQDGMARHFENVKEEFYSVAPHIDFKHRRSGLICELRAATDLPIKLSSLLCLYDGLDPRAVKLGVAFKYWAKIHKLDQHTHGRYAPHIFVIMVLHYLQQVQPPVLPVLHELAGTANKPESEVQNGDEDESVDMTTPDITIAHLSSVAGQWTTKNTQSVGELWIGLLRYYAADFSTEERAVSIRQLAPLLRKDREWGSARLAVEDPITKYNTTRGTSNDAIFEYLMFCVKRTACYFMQLQGRLQWLFSNSPPLPACLMRIFSLSEEACAPVDKTETLPLNEEVALSTTDKENEEEDDEVASKKPASLGDWEQTVRNITKQLCDVQMTKQPVYLLEKSFMSKENIPYACLLCRKNNHLALECPQETLHQNMREPRSPRERFVRKLTMTFEQYFDKAASSEDERRKRCALKDSILKDIQRVFPNAQLELFGSSANGFGSSDSDADLCLILNEEYTCEKGEIISRVAEVLEQNEEYSKIQPITAAKVPIVKFFANRWKIQCDVSLENMLALHNTRLLKLYGDIDDHDRIRVLGFVVKHFAKVCDMCDAASGSLSSYAYILMLIHFLQQTQPPVLPVLQELHDGSQSDQPVPVDQWNCYYFQNRKKLMKVWRPKEINRLPPGDLWLDFLWYYVKEFDWTRQVVSVKQFKPLWKFDKLWQAKPMCIEDPFNLDHNLAQAVSPRMRTYILMRFNKAYIHHCKERDWKKIDNVMDSWALCGNYKAPKYNICEICNYKGHIAANCPKKEPSHHDDSGRLPAVAQ